MKKLEGGLMPDSVKVLPRPGNILGDGLKGILQHTLGETKDLGDATPAPQPPQDTYQGTEEMWEEYMFCGPGDPCLGPHDEARLLHAMLSLGGGI